MEAVLFLDKENKTDYFSNHIGKWKALQEERKKFEKIQAKEVAKILEQREGIKVPNDFLQAFQISEVKEEVFSTEYFAEQIAALRDLNRYSC